MPVLNKDEHRRIKRELHARISIIVDKMEGREIKSNSEGVKGRGHWVNPDSKCATVGSAGELRLAVDDFKSILAEIKRLK